MLQNILNLEGVTVLGKKQQEAINGGQICSFILTDAQGMIDVQIIDNMPEGQAGSDLANQGCVYAVITEGTGVHRCQYDCTFDN